MHKIKLQDAIALAEWYQKNKRELPWRDTGNPYDVWLSEIMLQQTRIEAVRPKYLMFKKELPSIRDLAEVDDDRLMRLWEGMGYYSRARNLKKCAKVIMNEYDGILTDTYEVLKKLPGIGPYTAGAIASIAYGNPAPAVDGNVMRVLARYFAIEDDIRDTKLKQEFEDMIMTLYKEKNDSRFVSSFNQGVMELGETICVPNGKPDCVNCPLNAVCRAHLEERTDSIPYRSPLKKRKIIERTLLVLRDGDSFLLHKRPDTGLLAGLYEFIGIEEKLSSSEAVEHIEEMGITPLRIKKLPSSKHIFTHLEWHMTAYEVTVAEIEDLAKEDYVLANKKELSDLAIPSAFRTYVNWYELRDQ